MLGLITFQYHKNNNHNTTNEFNEDTFYYVIFWELYFLFLFVFYFVNFIVLFLDYLFGLSEGLMM